MTPQNQRIVVTGGAGFIGSHVVDLLVAANNRVVVVDTLSTGTRRNLSHHLDSGNDRSHAGRVALVEADVTDGRAMNDVIADADVVVHMAVACVRTGIGRPLHVHEVNVSGTLNVCLAATRNRVGRLVYVSSSQAYGTAQTVPMTEDHPTEPTTIHGASKLMGETYTMLMARTYGLPVVIVRLFNSYGPREPALGTGAEVIPKFVLRTMAGARPVVFGSGLQTRDFVWVEDSARGIVCAAVSDACLGTVVNLGRGQEVSIRQLAAKILAILGRGAESPIFDRRRPGDVERHRADIRRAGRLLSWHPTVSIDEGLRRYIDWLVDSGIDADAWLARDERRNW